MATGMQVTAMDPAGMHAVILMYHGTPPGVPSSKYSLRTGLFRRHVEYLYRQGWRTATVRDLARTPASPGKTVAITFDDGYLDNYEGAFRALVAHGMVATWYVTTDCIGGHAHWMGAPSEETRMLTAAHLRDMVAEGMEIGSHTCSHPDLTTLSPAARSAETTKSRAVLEDLLQQPVTSFAYPYGRFDEHCVTAVRDAGYTLACTTRPGWLAPAAEPLALRRVTIFSGDSPAVLGRKLSFADNDVSWRRLVGYYLSRIRSRTRGLATP